jgi:hypothetical protein
MPPERSAVRNRQILYKVIKLVVSSGLGKQEKHPRCDGRADGKGSR